MLSWLDRNGVSLVGLSLLTTADFAELLERDPRTAHLEVTAVNALADCGDIQLAERVLAGEVAAVLFFIEAAAAFTATPDLRPLLRACNRRDIPLALNASTADLALRGFAHGRLAHLIFNPAAGQGDPNADLALIRSLLEPQLLLNVVLTQPDLDPAAQTRELIETIQARQASEAGSAMILASGGDGTVSAVAGAILGTAIPLGIIPRGTANAFGSALGLPLDVRGACNTILAGHTLEVDAARCNDTPMILLAGLGFEAGMVDRASRELKNRLGPLAYVLAGAQQLVSQQTFHARMEMDGEILELEAAAITIANAAPATSVLAQGFGLVIPDDGLLEITIATSLSNMQGLHALASLMTSAVVGSATERDDLLCMRAKQITVSTDPPQKLVIDGEILEANPITFSCMPRALTLLAPIASRQESP
jgi:YegS/Rv2252/BmrU family lipid kinase